MKKYEITDIAHPDNPNLHRIRAVTDLTEDVLAGMLGGYVESCDNLDQDGRAWISADAIACENAVVCGDAVLTDHAVAKGCAYVGKPPRGGRQFLPPGCFLPYQRNLHSRCWAAGRTLDTFLGKGSGC